MAETRDVEQDPPLEALTELSQTVLSGAENLIAVSDNLDEMKRRRREGWSWRRIVAATGSPNPMSVVTNVATSLASATGRLRRELVRGLRGEGMQVKQIASVFEVSRQRVGALIRGKRST